MMKVTCAEKMRINNSHLSKCTTTRDYKTSELSLNRKVSRQLETGETTRQTCPFGGLCGDASNCNNRKLALLLRTPLILLEQILTA